MFIGSYCTVRDSPCPRKAAVPTRVKCRGYKVNRQLEALTLHVTALRLVPCGLVQLGIQSCLVRTRGRKEMYLTAARASLYETLMGYHSVYLSLRRERHTHYNNDRFSLAKPSFELMNCNEWKTRKIKINYRQLNPSECNGVWALLPGNAQRSPVLLPLALIWNEF